MVPSDDRQHLDLAHPILQRNKVRVIGHGKPPMLFCHGFGCDQHIWRYLTPALAARYQLVLFDHVGAGESDARAYDPQKYSTLAGYAHDVVQICQVLGLQQVTVVGHSVGAMIALLAAISAPEHFAKAVMLAPSPCYLNAPNYHGGLNLEDAHQLLALMEQDYDGWAHLFAGLLLGPANPAAMCEELAGYFCRTDSTMAKQFARVAFLSDNRPEVARMPVPTLLLQCSRDAVAPAEVGAYLLAHLPEATLITLQATGHCPHLSAPLETLAAMDPFLAA
ncbi:alpha/beta hydrolase [Hymenobacter sp. YC55]|uniref:alpha/beta fold hydrolase n=1 Tax=Hymenobacter sp. YC55 TaxID=3034019 RepID=UPI0023F72A70|nr:alpha/beta hydrolase [Hymenobacter sp. YC55]MDF7815424.1 alpha/beta hydrolase [Hymenobacter sp. YC55]